MATLQNIRNRSGLLLAVIGIAMLAFILGDLLKSSNSGGGNTNVGTVLGEDISIRVFQQQVDKGLENWKTQNPQAVLDQSTISQIRGQVWDQYVRDLVMNNEFKQLGIDISDQEWIDRISGANVHPQVSEIPLFANPSTGIFDGNRALEYLQNFDQDISGESRNVWLRFEEYLINLIKNTKYNALLAKAIFVTTEEAKSDFNSNNRSVKFNYVAIPFSSLDDAIEVTDDDMKSYYSDHKNEYTQDASKDVDFVVYNVVPSSEDDANTREEITDLAVDFESYLDYELMARRNSDNTNSRFVYSKENELQDPNWEGLFNSNKGTVIGPYLTNPGVYRIAKLAELEYRSDSLEVRHILIKPTETVSLDSANRKIDNFKLAIKSGSDFGVLAKQYSEHQPSAIKRGDLGWFNEDKMTNEFGILFNDACFSANKGDLVVATSYLGVHLIEVTKTSRQVKKVKIAYIDRRVEPSTETFNIYYNQAAKFAGKIINDGIPFDTLVLADNLLKRSDKKVGDNKQNIVGLPNSRDMVKWMNTAEVGSVSEVFQFDNLFVVAYLKREYTEGIIALEDVQEQIRALVIKEKKSFQITKSISSSDLYSIASVNKTTVVKEKKAVFGNLSIDGIGYEPELVGSIFATSVGDISSPIIGRNAVYVVEVLHIDEEYLNRDFQQQKLNLQTKAISNANRSVYNALKEAAEVQDNRSDFY
jgi:peptidyl-prolyl cis-trans isomerase D